jgi:UDP-3-O-[3-hydroxymyristoyl] glucosamine N-acyltransferase
VPRLAELAARAGGEVVGDGERVIAAFASLEDAGPEDLSLYADARYRAAAAASAAGALLMPRAAGGGPALEPPPGRDLVLVADPRRAMALVLAALHPPHRPEPGVHPTAVVGAGCAIDPSAHVGPYAVVGAGSTLEAEVVIEAHAVVGRDCRIGAGSRLHPHAVLYDRTELGARCELHAGAVVGCDGFGYAAGGDGLPSKVPQVGRAVLGPDVEIGANSTIDRATLGATRVGAGSKLDNLVHLGHNVQLGRGCLLAAHVGIAGSTRLGDGVVLAGQVGVTDHLEIGAGAQVAAKSAVMKSVAAGTRVGGIPARDLVRWQRQVAAAGRLAGLVRRVAALERRLGMKDEGSGA